METAVRHDELLAEMGWVQGLARRLLLDAARADDAAQEALALALSAPPRRARRGPALRAFLATATRIVARDQRRSERRRHLRERQAARPEATGSTVDLVERSARARTLVAAVEALDEPYRSAVRLRYLEQLSVREVAARTGAQPVTVRKRLSRALAMLRARLEAEWGGAPGAWAMALLPLAAREGVARAMVPGLAALAAAGLACFGLQHAFPGQPAAAPAVQPPAIGLAAALPLGETPVESVAPAREPAAEPRADPAPRGAPRAAPDQDNAALLAAAFQALHAVGRVGQEACAAALEQPASDCSACHGETPEAGGDPSREGWSLLLFDDGTPRAEGPLVHGQRYGEWTEWHPGGEVAGRGAYFDGARHGWWTFWQPDGEHQAAEGEFLYGEREGSWVEYGPGGARAASATWRRGLRHGVERTWHSGGERLASEVAWHAGEREGLARTWHPDGTPASEGWYDRGRPVGRWRAWGADGRPVDSPPVE